MMRFPRIPALVMFLLAATHMPASAEDRASEGQRFVDTLARGDFASAVASFDDTMKAAAPEPKLREMWSTLEGQVGKFRERMSARTESAGAHEIVFVTCQFERASLDVKVVFDASGRIAGLFFSPAQSAERWQPPVYCDTALFVEHDVTVGTGEWSLPGTLSLPKSETPRPVVVLVHGSGPHDRDETIGPNKPFADLACGLASRGVAVLRYEKRTQQHRAKLLAGVAGLTVKEETIDDALAAVRLLRATAGVDSQRIYVLGHSLGGMLVPRIGREAPELAGLIVLAGNARPLEDLVLEQSAYLASLSGTTSEATRDELTKLREQVAQVKALGAAPVAPNEPLLLGIPASYWLDLKGYRPAEEARSLKQSLLVLQGERDYQVTMEDFRLWKEALGSRAGVRMKSYPDLNHLFIAGRGKSTPVEYDKLGHVAEAVIADLVSWISP